MEGRSVPTIRGRDLSAGTQPCQLTSPGLMSLSALSCSRKLLSGKDASALGVQLWLPSGVKRKGRGSAGYSSGSSEPKRQLVTCSSASALTGALKQKKSGALAVQEVSGFCRERNRAHVKAQRKPGRRLHNGHGADTGSAAHHKQSNTI